MEKKKVILVVDDELEFLKMIRMRLEANDYEVVTAVDGKEALNKAKKYKLDAVLLDILMPGMSGLDVLKELRNKNKSLPVFIITAFSSEDRFELANKYNASGFIVKTSDLKQEVDNITSLLRIADKYKG
jgi:DNA-binding response OmpR family regulator